MSRIGRGSETAALHALYISDELDGLVKAALSRYATNDDLQSGNRESFLYAYLEAHKNSLPMRSQLVIIREITRILDQPIKADIA